MYILQWLQCFVDAHCLWCILCSRSNAHIVQCRALWDFQWIRDIAVQGSAAVGISVLCGSAYCAVCCHIVRSALWGCSCHSSLWEWSLCTVLYSVALWGWILCIVRVATVHCRSAGQWWPALPYQWQGVNLRRISHLLPHFHRLCILKHALYTNSCWIQYFFWGILFTK